MKLGVFGLRTFSVFIVQNLETKEYQRKSLVTFVRGGIIIDEA